MILLWSILTLLMLATLVAVLLPLREQLQQYKIKFLSLAIIVIFTSFSIYHIVGSSAQLAQSIQLQKRAKFVAKVMSQFNNIQEVIDRMKQTLQQQPDSAKGWYLLGRLYSSQGDYQNAHRAFERSQEIVNNNKLDKTPD